MKPINNKSRRSIEYRRTHDKENGAVASSGTNEGKEAGEEGPGRNARLHGELGLGDAVIPIRHKTETNAREKEENLEGKSMERGRGLRAERWNFR